MGTQPRVTAETAAFWQGCTDGVLLYQCCSACGHVQFPPRFFCVRCRSRAPEWRPAAGTGTVYSYTVVHRAPTPAFKDDVPYVIALVDFDEGFRMMVNLRGCPAGDLRIGLRVGAFFEPAAGGGALPQVRPLEDGRC